MQAIIGRAYTQDEYVDAYHVFSRPLVTYSCPEAKTACVAIAATFMAKWRTLSPERKQRGVGWVVLSLALQEACTSFDPETTTILGSPSRREVKFELPPPPHVSANLASTEVKKKPKSKNSSPPSCTTCGYHRGHTAEQCQAHKCFYCLQDHATHDELLAHRKDECKKRRADPKEGDRSDNKRARKGKDASFKELNDRVVALEKDKKQPTV
jgi:hypothetical protein